jgi:hypothetical protein
MPVVGEVRNLKKATKMREKRKRERLRIRNPIIVDSLGI